MRHRFRSTRWPGHTWWLRRQACRIFARVSGKRLFALGGWVGGGSLRARLAWMEDLRRMNDLHHPETVAYWESWARRMRMRADDDGLLSLLWCEHSGTGSVATFIFTERRGEGWRRMIRRQRVVALWWHHCGLPRPRLWFSRDYWRFRPSRYQVRLRDDARPSVWHTRLHPPWPYLLPYAFDELCWRLFRRYPTGRRRALAS